MESYQNVTEDKKYLGQEGLYLPMGGETCPPDGVSPADCSKAQEEMRNLRWSYLNSDYYKGVNDRWIAQGCMVKLNGRWDIVLSLLRADIRLM